MAPDDDPAPSAAPAVEVVTLAEGAARLDKALAAALPALSRSRLQALIAAGHVRSGGRTITDASGRVKPGETFEVALPPPELAAPRPQPMDLAIVYEDAALLVVDKPAGLVVHPAAGNPDGTLVNGLLAHCGASLSGIGGVARPGIVHRLDKDTSGLMVVAKSDAAHHGLAAQFADRTLSRTYQAVVWGLPNPTAGEVDAPIGRDPRDRQRMAVVARGGKHAVTRYRTLQRAGGRACLVECRLLTGRTHQIRVHLGHIGHPLVGDPLYGRRRIPGGIKDDPAATAVAAFPRQALHAVALTFRHPLTGETLQFASPLPQDITDLLSNLECF
ncbi:MAG TPA: RluA family pseudouridine synthase [Alphaproteobacteria bacterium]|nr:RluA family pseudouridine synthase [Alphaproteobacteria bacterium]